MRCALNAVVVVVAEGVVAVDSRCVAVMDCPEMRSQSSTDEDPFVAVVVNNLRNFAVALFLCLCAVNAVVVESVVLYYCCVTFHFVAVVVAHDV